MKQLKLLITFILLTYSFAAFAQLQKMESPFTVDETVKRLKDQIKKQKFQVFTIIDHEKEAKKVRKELPPTQLIVFGDPAAGTNLMQKEANIAIDLPLKLLVRKNDDRKTDIIYYQPSYLLNFHGIKDEELANKLDTTIRRIIVESLL